jgi:hypothetical protein
LSRALQIHLWKIISESMSNVLFVLEIKKSGSIFEQTTIIDQGINIKFRRSCLCLNELFYVASKCCARDYYLVGFERGGRLKGV